MKKSKQFKIFLLAALVAVSSGAFAQVKIGDNPTTINAGSVLELESANKGLMMPRVSLTNTTTWSLLGTAAAGMHVYNTNTGITSSNILYPTLVAKIGEYYWDGTGWVALAPVGAQNSPVQVKIQSTTDQVMSNNFANNTVVFANTIFDTGSNKVGNTVLIPSTGLYDLTAYCHWTTTASGGYGVRLFVNNSFTGEQFSSSTLSAGTNAIGAGRLVRRLNAGDIVSVVMVNTLTSGTMTLLSGTNFFTVIKVSN